jgi:hypothetical protein
MDEHDTSNAMDHDLPLVYSPPAIEEEAAFEFEALAGCNKNPCPPYELNS